MAYATSTQFRDKYGKDYMVRLLASLESGASRSTAVLDSLLGGTPPSGADEEALQRGIDRIDDLLDSQSDLADSYLRQAVTLPIEATVLSASPIAGYVLDLVRYAAASATTMRTELVREDYVTAIQWFRDVSRGLAVLQYPDGSTTPVSPAGGSRTMVFTDSVLDKMPS